MLPTVALVGPPNSGKSSLLNKIAGQMLAVTSPVAGTTRDRQYAEIDWSGNKYFLVDTAGLDLEESGELEESVRDQILIAQKNAQVIILVVDGKQPATALDKKVLKLFRNTKVPIALVINKTDSPKARGQNLADFAWSGIKDAFPVSALTGGGLGDLLDWINENLPHIEEPEIPKGIAVSILGKPNVGKSSLVNAILGEERVVVSATAGTTRTAIDTPITIDGQDYTFIDTAGLKRKNRHLEEPEKYSGFQALKSIHRSDVCILVFDASQELTHQDQAIAQTIQEADKACILVASKGDLYHKGFDDLEDYARRYFPFWWMAPFVLVSSKKKTGIKDLLAYIAPVAEAHNRTVPQEQLDAIFQWAMKTNPPRRLKDEKVPKVKSIKQVGTAPPSFLLYVNKPAAVTREFTKFLTKNIIKKCDLIGTQAKISLKPFLAKE